MSIFQQTGAKIQELGRSIDTDFTIPSCTIEDVDRALFNLFNTDLKLFYKQGETIVRVPVVFATGERFAILSRNKPLRDANNTLILPLISIARTGIDKDVIQGMGTNQANKIVIKKRLSKDDPRYQRLVNKEALENQDDRASNSHLIGTGSRGDGTQPGQLATRRPQAITPDAYRLGKLLKPSVGNNIVEIFEIPNAIYYKATYEITFWTQYTQQMNHLLMSLMSSSHTGKRMTFRIETDKGYFFVAYLAGALSPNNNFSDFTDSERIVKYSFSLDVPAYIVSPDFEGSTNTISRYVSAPQVSFDMTAVYAPLQSVQVVPVASANQDAYLLNDLGTADEPLPGQSIVAKSTTEGGAYYDNASLGDTRSGRYPVEVVRTYRDPVTDEVVKEVLPFKSRNQRQGETVYKAQITDDLGTILLTSK